MEEVLDFLFATGAVVLCFACGLQNSGSTHGSFYPPAISPVAQHLRKYT
jgi:hypothetical protein